MSSKRHTVIFVPHAHAKFRKLQVTTFQIVTAALSVLAVTAGALFIAWCYLSPAVDSRELARLKVENAALREMNNSFESSIRDIRQQLTSYEDRTRRLAIVAGLDELGGGQDGGLGGEEPEILGPEPQLSALASWAGRLDGDLAAVESAVDRQRLRVSSLPSIAPTHGLRSSGFGYRRDPFTGHRAFHQGLDITAAPDRPVQATADGIVIRAGRLGRLGNAVTISHGFGLSTRYGHLDRVAVTAGQRVHRGEVVGYVGSTGRSTGYHLHYEVRKDGKPVDPMIYILDGPSGRRF